MLIKNRFLLLRLLITETKDFLWSNWRKIVCGIFILLILLGGYRVYSYYNRLEFIGKYEYHGDIFEHYIDWSRSTHYYLKFTDRMCVDNYYVIKKNGKIYFRYQHNYKFDVSYDIFHFKFVELDSLVLVQRGFGGKYGVVYLKMPLNKNTITKKDIRIISIYPGMFRDGSKQRIDDSTHYFLDDFKKVPIEVINYENIISDY